MNRSLEVSSWYNFGAVQYALIILAIIGFLGFLLPFLGLLSQIEMAPIWHQLAQPEVYDALWLSVKVSTTSLIFSLFFGLPIAFILARRRFFGRDLVYALIHLPMVMPPVVVGVALLMAFGRRGLCGDLLAAMGIQLPFTTASAIIAASIVSTPFLIIAVEAGFAKADPRLEYVAATLGASPWRIFWTVTVPSIRASLFAGMALCWARSIGEFGATIAFAGNLQGRTQTMPLAVYTALHTRPQVAIVLSIILLVVSVIALFILRKKLHQP